MFIFRSVKDLNPHSYESNLLFKFCELKKNEPKKVIDQSIIIIKVIDEKIDIIE